MSSFEDAIIQRIRSLEREVERLKRWERPVIITDHGALTGLGDDDHTQYLNTTRHDTTTRHTLGTVVPHDDHGQLTGLADNDHPQYLLTTGKAADSDKLDGVDSTEYQRLLDKQRGIELAYNYGSDASSYLDFHTINDQKDYDARIIASGGSGSVGEAQLNYYASAHVFDGTIKDGNGVEYSKSTHNHTGTYLPINGKAADSNKLDGKTFTDIMALIYPVGAIYISTSSTSPATLFGGTWAAYGEGRVLVGKAASGTFATAGSTGGSETHSHGLASGFAKITASTSGWIAMARKATASWTTTNKNNAANNTSTGDSVSYGAELGGSTDNGSSLQPYVVVYMWRRTA